MNQEEFLKKLEAVAKLHDPQAIIETVTDYQEIDGELVEVSEQIEMINDTHPCRIKRVYPITKACEDCGLTQTDRRVQLRYYDSFGGQWRRLCVSCKLYQNPLTGQFEWTAAEIINYWQNKNRCKNIYKARKTKFEADNLKDKTSETK